MTIRFAPARNRNPFRSVVIGARNLTCHGRACNDNGLVAANDDALLHRTLRHFSEHGLSAAAHARDKALEALHAGDEAGHEWWHSICRMLDRRMADQLAADPVATDRAAGCSTPLA